MRNDACVNEHDSTTGDENRATLAGLRTDYHRGGLLEADLERDPLRQFARWMTDARQLHSEGRDEPHAMTLSTADSSGAPSSRTVLLKGLDERGFVWFTNYASQKGRELGENPRASLNFRWGGLERQVTAAGRVERVDADESDEYFNSRPIGSRISAIISAQSTVISSRDEIEQRAQALADGPVSAIIRPEGWGGFRLVPVSIEFWQGRPSRLHDRLRFRRLSEHAPWILERLAP